MTETLGTPRLLAVDDEKIWRMILGTELGRVAAEALVVDDVAAGMHNIETQQFTGVISDGLEGAWQTLWERSRSLDLGFVLFSGSEPEINKARQRGVPAFNKVDASADLFRNMFGLLLPR